MKSVHVIAVGDFGIQAAQCLRELRPGVRIEVPADDAAHGSPDAAGWVLLAWRPVPALSAQLDASAYSQDRPWLPVVVEHPELRIGPVVVPRIGPCLRCFELRRSQHSRAPEVQRALAELYDERPDAGPQGYPPGLPILAAAATDEILAKVAADPAAVAGQVRTMNLLSGHLGTGRVVGTHGCSRCGAGRAERDRSSGQLLSDLKEMLAWTS